MVNQLCVLVLAILKAWKDTRRCGLLTNKYLNDQVQQGINRSIGCRLLITLRAEHISTDHRVLL